MDREETMRRYNSAIVDANLALAALHRAKCDFLAIDAKAHALRVERWIGQIDKWLLDWDAKREEARV